jgi:hypothetical protein
MLCIRGFYTVSLRDRTLREPPLQQKRDDDPDEDGSPNQTGVDVDQAHSCEQENDASQQK